MYKLFLYLFLTIVLTSCGGEDDICTSGEATPRIILKFKTASTNKIRTLDSIFVSVDLGNGLQRIITSRNSTDSIIVPLRVDDALFTDFYVKLGPVADSSKIRINYTTKSEYVSPACGVKKIYENVNSTLLSTNPVLKIEQTQNIISNEDKTSFFLLF